MTKDDNNPWYTATTFDMSDQPGYTLISTQEVTFEIPDAKSVYPKVIENLVKERENERALAAVKIMALDAQIGSLMGLEHQS